MAKLVPPPVRRRSSGLPMDVARTLDRLATTVMILVTIGGLYFAREILIPVAIAVILSFVLSPLVKRLRRFGLGKKPAVGLAVLLTFLVAVGLGAILAKQVSDLAGDASRYQATISHKVDGVRDFAASNPLLGKLNSLIADMSSSKAEKPRPALFPSQGDGRKTAPLPVELVQAPPGVLSLLQTAAGMVANPLATAAFVAIFIVFILMQREDLRNRFIRLAGSHDLQRTTLALNDAARRLSRYFLAQVLLNAGFGIVTAVALSIIGVPSAILWGIVATFMRFIPYVGSLASALFPILLSLAASPGWAMAVETAAFFAALEFIIGQVVEPLVYGHNTGISPIAVVLSATFWTWLWGPVGLVLATPLSVCVVVLGRHVERLSFLDVLLGDAPPLTEVENFYQRMLSGDASEVFEHAETYVAENSLLTYCDHIAMKALLMAQEDVRRGVLNEERQLRIRDTMRDLAEDLADRGGAPILPVGEVEAPASLEPATAGTGWAARPRGRPAAARRHRSELGPRRRRAVRRRAHRARRGGGPSPRRPAEAARFRRAGRAGREHRGGRRRRARRAQAAPRHPVVPRCRSQRVAGAVRRQAPAPPHAGGAARRDLLDGGGGRGACVRPLPRRACRHLSLEPRRGDPSLPGPGGGPSRLRSGIGIGHAIRRKCRMFATVGYGGEGDCLRRIEKELRSAT